jgi:hypothetical protein
VIIFISLLFDFIGADGQNVINHPPQFGIVLDQGQGLPVVDADHGELFSVEIKTPPR